MSDYLGEEDLVRVVLESIVVGVTVQDRRGRLRYANHAAAKASGFADARAMLSASPGEILDRFELVGENGALLEWSMLPGRRVLAGESPPPLLVGFRPRHSRIAPHTWSLVRADAIHDANGDPVLAVNVFLDATAAQRQKESARILARATAGLASSLDHGTMLACVVLTLVPDLASGCLVALGAGGVWRAAGAAGDRAEVAEAVARVLAGVPPILESDLLCVPIVAGGRIEGTITLVSSPPERSFDEQDLALVSEIGRRTATAIGHARAYDAATAAIRQRDEFLAVAGHELRTPLATLLLQLENLKRTLSKQRIDEALAQAAHLAKLIDELLDITRVVGGRLSLERETMDLADLLRAVGRRFADIAERERSKLVVSAGAPCIGVWDGRRLDQVVSNLVSNALKYGGGGEVELACETSDTHASIHVTDHGIGVDVADIERIFNRFERASAPREKPGLGLGLFIARAIVDAHGGTIRVASSPGAGSRFTVELPRLG